jgi:hypothetical protein
MAAPGQQPLTGGQQNSLASALSNVSPPAAKPSVPFVRTDPQHSWLIGLQRVRQSLHDLDEHLDDKEPAVQDTVSAMASATEKLMAGVPPPQVALLAAAQLLKNIAPQLSQQCEQQWATINRPPQVPGVPIPSGPPPGGPGAQPPGVSPAQNPGVLAAMAGAMGGGAGPGSQPPGLTG